MSTLSEFISQRRSEIKATQSKLKLELKELAAAEKAAGLVAVAPKSKARQRKRASGRASKSGPTMREMVEGALTRHSNGLQNPEFIKFFKNIYDKDVKSTSLSPLLSRLRSDGVIDRTEDNVWFLVKEEPPVETGGLFKNEGEGRSGRRLPIQSALGSTPNSSIPNPKPTDSVSEQSADDLSVAISTSLLRGQFQE